MASNGSKLTLDSGTFRTNIAQMACRTAHRGLAWFGRLYDVGVGEGGATTMGHLPPWVQCIWVSDHSNATITASTFIRNGRSAEADAPHGIIVADGRSNITLDHSSLTNNEDVALWLTAATARVTSCTVSHNVIPGDPATVRLCRDRGLRTSFPTRHPACSRCLFHALPPFAPLQSYKCNSVLSPGSHLVLDDVVGMTDRATGALWVTADQDSELHDESVTFEEPSSRPHLLPLLSNAVFANADDPTGHKKQLLLGSPQVCSSGAWLREAVACARSLPSSRCLRLALRFRDGVAGAHVEAGNECISRGALLRFCFQVVVVLSDTGAFFPWHARCRFDNQTSSLTKRSTKVANGLRTWMHPLRLPLALSVRTCANIARIAPRCTWWRFSNLLQEFACNAPAVTSGKTFEVSVRSAPS